MIIDNNDGTSTIHTSLPKSVADKVQEPFCDNPKCNFNRISVSRGCTGIESGTMKVARMFFIKPGSIVKVKLCGVCAEVVPMFVQCADDKDTTSPVIQPGAKQLIIADSF